MTNKYTKSFLILCVALSFISANSALASTNQCLSVKSKLCNSYKELNQIRKQSSFIEYGFSPGGQHHKWLEQAKKDGQNEKYDKFMLCECKSKELGCDGSNCVTFGDVVTLALDAASTAHPGQYSQYLHLMDNNFKKFCKK